jgi:hypothetical protein
MNSYNQKSPEATMMEIFDPKSIEANKQGQKTEKQIKEIKEAVQPGLWLYFGLGILVFGGCFSSMMSAMGGSGAVGAFGWIIAAVGLFAAVRGFSSWNVRRKLLSEKVQSAEGTVSINFAAETTEGLALAPMGMAGMRAPLPPGDYRFFFLKTRNYLLGAEPLSTEEELRNGLNEALAAAIGYDKSQLDESRKQAQDGTLKTLQDTPKLDTHQSSTTVYEQGEQHEAAVTNYSCTLGDIKFDISEETYFAILKDIPYRIYYREGETSIMAIEVA